MRRLANLVALLMSCAPDAMAHSSLLESVPGDGAVVAAGDTAIELHFDSRLDPRFSRLTMTNPDGRRSVLPLQGEDRPGVMKATGTRLGEGSYLLHWRVLSIDGHAGEGQIRFRVGR